MVNPYLLRLGAVVLEGNRNSPTVPQRLFSLIKLSAKPAGTPVVAVEYFNSNVGHYFLTALDDEVDKLDAGRFSGWGRSIGSLAVYPTAASAPAGATPVCRFFSSRFTSHFYSADAAECDAVAQKWPESWTLETREAFYVMPAAGDGSCASGYQPVYRLYAQRNGANHRYVADAKLRQAMVDNGWIPEGRGMQAVAFCTPG